MLLMPPQSAENLLTDVVQWVARNYRLDIRVEIDDRGGNHEVIEFRYGIGKKVLDEGGVMNAKELDVLEKVFAKEIDGAINKHPGLFQTKSKLAKKLEGDGLLVKVTKILGGRFPVTIEGYRLTIAGHAAYCMSERCADGKPLGEGE